MWLRPRTELFPSDPRWWEFNDDGRWLAVSLGFGLINLLYVALAAAGPGAGANFSASAYWFYFCYCVPHSSGPWKTPSLDTLWNAIQS